MPKSTKELTVLEPMGVPKPLVKEFVDTAKNVSDFLKLRLPHQAYSSPHCKLVYTSKDKATFRYRVNYWATIDHGVISTGQITKSLYVEVNETPGGGYTFKDLTGDKGGPR